STSIFKRRMTAREVIPAIIADRSAALICLGLSGLDDRTLDYLGDHPSILERIYERPTTVTAFGAFAGSLQIDGNRVIPPGGQRQQNVPDDAVVMWEAVVGEKVTRVDRFIVQLFELNEGRIAYLYDTIGQLDPARRAFALGLWMPNAPARLDRFKALAGAIAAFREAHLRTLPFGRASYDLSMTLTRRARCAPSTRIRSMRRGWCRRLAPRTSACARSASISSPSASVCSGRRRRPSAATCWWRCARCRATEC